MLANYTDSPLLAFFALPTPRLAASIFLNGRQEDVVDTNFDIIFLVALVHVHFV
jgi:hypothetical protein